MSVQSYFLLSSVLMLNAFIVFQTAARTVSLWLACRNTKCLDSESWGLQVLTAPDSAAPLRVTTCYLGYYIAKTVFQTRHRLKMGGGKHLDRGQHSTIHSWAGPEWQQYFEYLNIILMVNGLLPIMNSRNKHMNQMLSLLIQYITQ